MTVGTHGDLIVLPQWEIRPPHIMTRRPTQSHYPDTELTNQPLPYPINIEYQARKQQVRIRSVSGLRPAFDRFGHRARSYTEHPPNWSG